ncbi:MAG: flagellar export chaperone FliS [Yokenella regensburgei]|jgi:flagellar protein FliS|uniref:Flagellar secretion chaperone FliS n=1 Tax=Yokenella regensburgei TaxID=158877 RepID=A0AB38G3C9_9ENTR|nr:flagellar export chaperone FliS [Yokenella regensburgei]EHM45990.1 flagellar protein FliS [Yokenella regensburgei ATCC 43003]KAF1367384.1 flagellar protein FliS [Yokenella regensburgei]KFD21550.1 FliS family flagellar biosynthesis protein [Yokenella regensburgei ATCC 49455]MDQ4428389.1 flagellar export chaperone FliS [Yokenella regensburgei]MDR3105260.1 flagellar export chaperone FliS [Yokenella regensburgei]
MYNNSGVQAYQKVGLESAVLSASPHQLVVMLFDGALSAMVRARLFLEQGDIVAKGESLSKAINIIDNGLKAGLNMDVGGELPHNLSALYDYMVRRLLHANLRNDVAAISEVEALLNNIADAWKQIGPSSPSLQDVF